jgi:hypothetical protein
VEGLKVEELGEEAKRAVKMAWGERAGLQVVAERWAARSRPV